MAMEVLTRIEIQGHACVCVSLCVCMCVYEFVCALSYCHKLIIFQFNYIAHSNIHPFFFLQPEKKKNEMTIINDCAIFNFRHTQMGRGRNASSLLYLSNKTHEPRMRT